MVKQATQREPDLDGIDPALASADHRGAQDAHRQIYNEALVAREVGRHLMEVPGLDLDHVLGILAFGMGRPVEVTRLRAPSPLATIGGARMGRTVARTWPVRECHIADLPQEIAIVDDLLNVADNQPDPEAVLISRDTLSKLARIMDELPARRRAILFSARVEGEPHRQIAATHGVSTRTIELEIRAAIEYCFARLHEVADPEK